MKKGFTLLELIVVIIILGILATLGMQQYFRVVEKSRSSEAKMILGHIRDIGAGFYTDHQEMLAAPYTFVDSAAGIGTDTNLIPSMCRNSHYFTYGVTGQTQAGFTAVATRCTAGSGGKEPQGPGPASVMLTTDFAAGAGDQDTWTYDAIYQ